MSKGSLFAIPMILSLLVAIALGENGMIWSLGTLLVGLAVVFFYIRKQKHDNEPTGAS